MWMVEGQLVAVQFCIIILVNITLTLVCSFNNIFSCIDILTDVTGLKTVYVLNGFLSCTQSKSAHVIGFNWTNLNEIVFITNQGLEFYQV